MISKKLALYTALIASFTLITPLSHATTPAPISSVRIGVVDVHEVLDHSKSIAAMRNALKKKFGPQQALLIEQQNLIKEKQKKLIHEKPTMKKEDQKKLKNEILTLSKALQEKQVKFQQAVFKAQDKSMSKLLKKFKAETKKVAKKEHLDMVLTAASTIYVADKYNITSKVKKAFK